MKPLIPLMLIVVIAHAAAANPSINPLENLNSETLGKPVNKAFLWGLAGFTLTLVPGVIGLSVGGQEGDISQAIDYGLVGSSIGAGVSLITSLVFSLKGDLFENTKPTYYGVLFGFGTLVLVAVAIYPEIVAALIFLPILVALKGQGCIN